MVVSLSCPVNDMRQTTRNIKENKTKKNKKTESTTKIRLAAHQDTKDISHENKQGTTQRKPHHIICEAAATACGTGYTYYSAWYL